MKIIAVFENLIGVGGAFNQGLNAILQMNRLCAGRFEFEVFTTCADNSNYLEKLGIRCTFAKISAKDKLIGFLATAPWWKRIQRYLKLTGPFEQRLIRHKCDLVYFLAPYTNPAMLQRLNYMSTVFDLCHRDTPEFPEVRCNGEFEYREFANKNYLARALIIVTESDQLADLISRRYGVDRERSLGMPMSPSPFLQSEFPVEDTSILKKYSLERDYFFYPAQFWPHKNHIRILEALVHLRKSGIHHRIVFAGGDHGNRSHIERFVHQHGLAQQVKLMGFVPLEEMRSFYVNCLAVVMPTYFGPTNMPPLEAWLLRKPLIYSSRLIEQVGDAAICVNPDDFVALAEAMTACMNSQTVENLVKRGDARLLEIGRKREAVEQELTERLLQFEIRRRCWD